MAGAPDEPRAPSKGQVSELERRERFVPARREIRDRILARAQELTEGPARDGAVGEIREGGAVSAPKGSAERSAFAFPCDAPRHPDREHGQGGPGREPGTDQEREAVDIGPD